jgi:hypothetical protein
MMVMDTPIAGGKRRVIVVEPDLLLRGLVFRLLEQMGFDLLPGGSVGDVSTLCGAGGELLVLDADLALDDQVPPIALPTVLLASSPDRLPPVLAPCAVALKPFRREELMEAIKLVAGDHRAHNGSIHPAPGD